MDKFDFTDELQLIIMVITPCCVCSDSDAPWSVGEYPDGLPPQQYRNKITNSNVA